MLPLLLAGGGMVASGAGAGMQYLGKRKAANRKAGAIGQARLMNAAIDQQERQANGLVDNANALALIDYFNATPGAQAGGAQAAAGRRAAITTAAGPRGEGLGTSNDGLAAALYQQSMGHDAIQRAAEDAGQVVSQGQRLTGKARLSSNQRMANMNLPLANSRQNAAVQRMQLQQWLEAQQTPTNAEANLDLFGNLLGGAGGMAGGMAGLL